MVFRQGLNADVLTVLACCDDEATLDSVIDLAIRIDNLFQDRHRRPNLTVSPLLPILAPMQLGNIHLALLKTSVTSLFWFLFLLWTK